MAILPFVLIVLALLVAWLVVREVRARAEKEARTHEEVESRTLPVLEYVVPTGQDPAVLVTALHAEGYETTVHTEPTHQHLLIRCPAGVDRDRAHVRAIIADQGTSMDDPAQLGGRVLFTDES